MFPFLLRNFGLLCKRWDLFVWIIIFNNFHKKHVLTNQKKRKTTTLRWKSKTNVFEFRTEKALMIKVGLYFCLLRRTSMLFVRRILISPLDFRIRRKSSHKRCFHGYAWCFVERRVKLWTTLRLHWMNKLLWDFGKRYFFLHFFYLVETLCVLFL